MTTTPAEILARQKAKLEAQLAKVTAQETALTKDPTLILKTAAADPVLGSAVVQAVYTATGNNGPATASMVGMAVSKMHTTRKEAAPKPEK
ncbi:hypothetical protein [Magnetospirillum molischianum]|uniref:Uncharacterized protein n=1 Tax=Magnetospirillum molischianum DSM 120 TaxID=1150626 RepID=H8FXU9_MAGML|nr:hypothetical protein [Magnetospirillum molischianum]CCG39911.1 hypothetical protein PHAMO_110004 [Magnetospirillum molischianum DSM 120]CCG39931.1 hypothetical protein PHAMO_130001 [Magnetospirillum molischianum DSM 120]CCG43187.1 hypothetical protein PHAMO_600004 [Magnetospirillum molischianum DSM 120]